MSDEIASERQSPSQRAVYDFLYHDARRIGSFLAQLSPYGLLQGVKANESSSRLNTGVASDSASSKFPGFMESQSIRSQTVTDSEIDAAERTYDPLWANARTMLNFLFDNSMLIHKAEKARIGQFVLISGSIAVFDMAIMETFWKNKVLRDGALDTLTKGVVVSPGHTVKKHRDTVSSLLDFVRTLPQTIQLGR